MWMLASCSFPLASYLPPFSLATSPVPLPLYRCKPFPEDELGTQDFQDKSAWMAVLHMERASYLEQFEHGMLSDEAFATLEHFLASMEAAADGISDPQKLSELYHHRLAALIKRISKPKKATKQKHALGAFDVALSYLQVGYILYPLSGLQFGAPCFSLVISE